MLEGVRRGLQEQGGGGGAIAQDLHAALHSQVKQSTVMFAVHKKSYFKLLTSVEQSDASISFQFADTSIKILSMIKLKNSLPFASNLLFD